MLHYLAMICSYFLRGVENENDLATICSAFCGKFSFGLFSFCGKISFVFPAFLSAFVFILFLYFRV